VYTLITVYAVERLTEKYEAQGNEWAKARMFAYSELVGMLTYAVEAGIPAEQLQVTLDRVAKGE
jgi:hypothetical protein